MPEYIFFNLATSGLDNKRAILQIGAVHSYHPYKKFNGYIQPGRHIHEKATKMHGYTTDRSYKKLFDKHGHELLCLDIQTQLRLFMNWMHRNFRGRVVLVSHKSFGYHAKVLLENLQNCNISYQKIAGFADSLVMCRNIYPKQPHNLEDMIEALGISFGYKGKALSYHALDRAYAIRRLVKRLAYEEQTTFSRFVRQPEHYRPTNQVIQASMREE